MNSNEEHDRIWRSGMEAGKKLGRWELVEWGEGRCDEHDHPFKILRFDCHQCREALRREMDDYER